jgi:hypothetical protein
MRGNNTDGLYPSIFLHRAHRGQLAIGGAMINRLNSSEKLAEVYEATPVSGGWRTRFEGGAPRVGAQDLPVSLSVMYIEGLIHISGDEGGYDSEVEIQPSCYALVIYRWNERNDKPFLSGALGKLGVVAKEERVYLQSRFSFVDRVQHDGVYDLKNAFDVARNKGPIPIQQRPHFKTRDWHLVPKTRVPGHVRTILHASAKAVDVVIDNNFGQGKKFFEPHVRRRK